MASQFFGDNDFWGVCRFNGVEIGTDIAGLGALYGMAIARMRGAGPDDSGVITHTGDLTADDLKIGESDTPGMSIVVQPGICIVKGVFTGIAAPVTIASISAPSVNPRIDIIQINQSGSVSRKAGTPAGSPVAPTPDANNYTLAEVLLSVDMTEIENSDCTDRRNCI